MYELQKVMARKENQLGSALEKMSGDLDAKLERPLNSKLQMTFPRQEPTQVITASQAPLAEVRRQEDRSSERPPEGRRAQAKSAKSKRSPSEDGKVLKLQQELEAPEAARKKEREASIVVQKFLATQVRDLRANVAKNSRSPDATTQGRRSSDLATLYPKSSGPSRSASHLESPKTDVPDPDEALLPNWLPPSKLLPER
ncbi:hypothetical protein V7S43_015478 [Phytophthora oleae]|uniref:Uncharacterized protein n=1 Tax=Phytophthora oleae TaxID=2107226 RepID=A0ABD3EZ03_9STRA